MFERFTDRARRVVVWAQEEARSFNHNYIGTEHLLLGLIREADGIGAKALAAAGVDAEMVREELDRRVGRGSSPPTGHIPFTPRAKQVLELSLREGLKLGHNYIGTEHILLGLISEGQGVAAQILLTRVDGGLEKVQALVVEQLGASGVPVERLAERIHEFRESMRTGVGRAVVGTAALESDVIKRLEAIEARLSAIERLLREQRGETEAS
jgi:ATP-dependent Clp protease ATP-binding subunit ClpC